MIVPKSLKCRLCKTRFPNPLRNGSQVVIVTCDDCRKAQFSAKSLRMIEKREVEVNKVKAKERANKIVAKINKDVEKEKKANDFISLYDFTLAREK